MKIIRIFSEKTRATPVDDFVRINKEPGLFDECDEVHISVTFTWQLERSYHLYDAWSQILPTKIGGPAFGKPSGDFTPGLYLKPGYVITSRGCPNHCWFCEVPNREGKVRELPIRNGWNVLDDNLLACSEKHILSVFAMLEKAICKAEFTGGLEAKLLKPWHVQLLANLKPKQMFFAYDTPDDYEPLVYASKMLLDAGFTKTSHCMRCYVLCGYENDTTEKAEKRLNQCEQLGMWPMPMVYRDPEKPKRTPEWVSWASTFTNWNKKALHKFQSAQK